MRLSSSAQAAIDWLRTLLRNSYFWGGMAVLVSIGLAVFLLIDDVIMPSYTRYDAVVRVPDVENQSFEEAQRRVEEQGLQVERQVGRFNPNVEQDIVVDQTPLPNADVKPGRRVYLTVNAGEVPMVEIPDLSGMSIREARNRISSLGLEVGTEEPDSIPSPYANTVTRQRPAPGDSIRQGNAVNIWYSTGLGDETVQVPNVVGQSLDEARRLLLQRKLRSVVVDAGTDESADREEAPPDERFVQEQGQSPGTSVRTGTEIRLFTTDDLSELPDSVETSDSES